MKMICTKEEYTRMVAQCGRNIDHSQERGTGCDGCILQEMCLRRELDRHESTPDDWILFLHDIVEIVDNPTLE